jgi:drug/metabolite transporter (DMT)-like permease
MKKNALMTGHLLALFSVLVWGTTFVATKLLLVDFEPVAILFYRFLIGYVMLWILDPHPLKNVSKRDELLFLLSGASGVTVYFLCENYALTYTYATNVSILVATAPFFTGLIAALISHEKMHPSFLIGFVISIVGIVLITTNGQTALHVSPLGDLLALGASLCWAVYSIATVAVYRPAYSSIATTRRIFFYGLVTMLPVMPLAGFEFQPAALCRMNNILLLLFQGVIASGLCYIIWNKAMKLLGAVKASVYIYLIPLITLIFSFFVLGERLTPVALIGCVLILCGLVLSQQKV